MSVTLSAETTALVMNQIKDGFAKNANKVETTLVDTFLTEFGQLATACELLGIKMIDQLGEIKIYDSVVTALRMHGHKTFELHLPDGDKFEVVMRYREGDTHIRSFGYKL